MPRFVVLAHDWPEPHLDLLLERDGVLKAWRLPVGFDPRTPTVAAANADHRLHYLDHEGPVSGDRGTVTRWDAGELVWVDFEPERLAARFAGTRLAGQYELVRRDERTWVLRVRPEPAHRDGRCPASPPGVT